MANKSTIPYLEELQRNVGEAKAAIAKLPISDMAKIEILKILEEHTNTAFLALKRAYEDNK